MTKSKIPLCDRAREEILSQVTTPQITMTNACATADANLVTNPGLNNTFGIAGLIAGNNINITDDNGCVTIDGDLQVFCGTPVAYVDGTYGNDGTGVVDRKDLAYQTIQAGITAVTGLGSSARHATVYVCPSTYSESPTAANFVDVYAKPGVIIDGGFTSPGSVDWRLYGDAIFSSPTGGILRSTGASNTIYFEFDRTQEPNPLNTAGASASINIDGDSNSDYNIRCNRIYSNGSNGSFLTVNNSTSSQLQLIVREEIQALRRVYRYIGATSTARSHVLQCPTVRLLDDPGNNVANEKSGLVVDSTDTNEVQIRFTGNIYNEAPDLTGMTDTQGCVQINGVNTVNTIVIINGDIQAGNLRGVYARDNTDGKLEINGSVVNNAVDAMTTSYEIMTLGTTPAAGNFFEVIVNNGYIQRRGSGLFTNGQQLITMNDNVKLWLNDCILQNQTVTGNQSCILVNTGAGPTTWVYSYNTNAVSGAGGFFIEVAVGALGVFGARDTNTNIGNSGVITTVEPWTDFTSPIVGFVVPLYRAV